MALFDDGLTGISPKNLDATTKLYSVEIFPGDDSTSVKLIALVTIVNKTDS